MSTGSEIVKKSYLVDLENLKHAYQRSQQFKNLKTDNKDLTNQLQQFKAFFLSISEQGREFNRD